MVSAPTQRKIPVFDRRFFESDQTFSIIGHGEIGGKAAGLAALRRILETGFPAAAFPDVVVEVPRLTVIGTGVFEQFMSQNHLYEVALSDLPDDRVAHAFLKAELPPGVVGDLLDLVKDMHVPLAVRSSSLLEDALQHPFAGTYATKMIANNQPDTDTRFRKLAEAIKYVWASTFFRDAKSYMRAIGESVEAERMAVVIQEIVGRRVNDRFYPTVSGVIRTHNCYPCGAGRPEDGVVNLALGLGKTIVDGGITWTYCPRFPRNVPPYGSISELLKNSQTRFWAVDMGPLTAYDPLRETEYMSQYGLEEAEQDGVLTHIASTYDGGSDRLVIGTGRPGPRVLSFAPLLDLAEIPLNGIVEAISRCCKESIGCDVEIEFAAVFDRAQRPYRFGVLQVRPMLVSDEVVEVTDDDLRHADALLASDRVLGNGEIDNVADVVYVKPDTFEARHTPAIATELESINRTLVAAGRPYALIGFGRWGSSDPWLGIPVTWPQIAGARVIVETTLPELNVEPSQGTHFFHNLTSFGVLYFTLHHEGAFRIDWDWLARLPALAEGKWVRHVRVRAPLTIKVDGRVGRGVVLHAPMTEEQGLPAHAAAMEGILRDLQERAKELKCLYAVEEIVSNGTASLEDVFRNVLKVIPPGWQFPEITRARITYDGRAYTSAGFDQTPWAQRAAIQVHGETVGTLEVFYLEEMPAADEGPFLAEERKLIDFIADRIGNCITHRHLMDSMREWQATEKKIAKHSMRDWSVILDLLRRTDQALLLRVARKMINHLCWSGVKEADNLLYLFGIGGRPDARLTMETNVPQRLAKGVTSETLIDEAFRIAAVHLSDEEIVHCIQKWIKQDRASFLVNALENHYTTLAEVSDAIHRYQHSTHGEVDLSFSTRKGLRVSLIRRFLTDQLEYINVAKDYVDITDFHDLLHRMIYPARGHGKVGGKSSGLFLASQIVRRHRDAGGLFDNLRTPKTWYVTSDGLHDFVYCNHLEDVFTQKYKDIDEVRQEYPDIVQVFKHSYFSSDIIKGLSLALDDFGDQPLIVRSSSLLEDRFGAAFSGKYKSLFLANQGPKRDRLAALTDAIAEVYASCFSPDPIMYRAERNLLDFQEGMGIMIQEVVGTRFGAYFAPAYAGVAFSNNEFRWSPRIRREDGLVRLVPGLGTRAVDRLGDEYPVLVSPGQPGLRVNATAEETVRYAPRYMDVINLRTNAFETVAIADVLRACGDEFPASEQVFSVYEHGNLRPPMLGRVDIDRDDPVVTFDTLLSRTPFLKQMNALLKLLEEKMHTPVDVEFASDGTHLYLLQCRAQTAGKDAAPVPIPHDVPTDRVVFTARRHVSNGSVQNITHIVYVDPEHYASLGSFEQLARVGRAVGQLNKLLPKRQFILMGPGRWGSRGDVKLGVRVTYSDISNTAMLIEIARKKGDYTPDLSFGTHFFQDLVESSIRYLPLYPDEPGIVFREDFLTRTENVLPVVAPKFADLSDVLHVIDVKQAAEGQTLHVAMNAELDEALAYLAVAGSKTAAAEGVRALEPSVREQDWRWRLRMAKRVAAELDPEQFGVKGLYIFGSVKNATAGPGSDIDLIVHFGGTDAQRAALEAWLAGWSLCLAEMNYLRTGYRSRGLLDVHFVTDEDIARATSFAAKINAITDAARPLPMKGQTPTGNDRET